MTSARRGRNRYVQVLLIVAAYYVFPVLEEAPGPLIWLRALVAVALFIVAVWWVTRQIVYETRTAAKDGPNRLLLLTVGGLMLFALIDLAVARAAPSEFTGLQTKTDALYFALTTLLTVGFGDVHAEGQVARTLLIVQLTFNAVVLTRAATVLSREAGRRSRPDPPHA
jgi:voltage-gated potassium channel